MPESTDNYTDFNDLVFEHRNKDYGAYVLRKAYFHNLMTGWIISMSLVIIFALTYFIILLFHPADKHITEFNPLLIQNNSNNIDLILPENPATTTNPNNSVINKELIHPEDNVTKHSSGQIAIDSTNSDNDTIALTNKGGGLPGDTNTTGGNGVYSYVENMPQFPGGQQGILDYILSHTRYPVQAIQYNIYGTVEVIFYITKDGLVDNVQVAKSANYLLDNEAVRVIQSMPKWKPGTRNGRPVTVMYKVPITFPPIVRKKT